MRALGKGGVRRIYIDNSPQSLNSAFASRIKKPFDCRSGQTPSTVFKKYSFLP
jgi:hypothetical protein